MRTKGKGAYHSRCFAFGSARAGLKADEEDGVGHGTRDPVDLDVLVREGLVGPVLEVETLEQGQDGG